MPLNLSTLQVLSFPDAIASIRERILLSCPSSLSRLSWERLEIPLLPADIKDILQAQTIYPRIYWQDRDGVEETY